MPKPTIACGDADGEITHPGWTTLNITVASNSPDAIRVDLLPTVAAWT